MNTDNLPSFRHPPVIETVLGVQFDPIPEFGNAHLGAFWKLLNDKGAASTPAGQWDQPRDAPPIEPAYEVFDTPGNARVAGWGLRLTTDAAARLQIRNRDGNAMVQVQNGRLHYNWIGRGDEYPRYEVVRPRFEEVYDLFGRFVEGENLPAIKPNQWEITYVNELPQGSVWQRPKDWPELFPGLPGCWAGTSRAALESVGGVWHYEIPPKRGRLHVELRHARTPGDSAREVLRLTLTARGPVDARIDLMAGLDLGREAIVYTFAEITSQQAHQFWGVTD